MFSYENSLPYGKQWYEQNITVKNSPLQLRANAIAHVRRKEMIAANAKEREAYRMVAHYQSLTRQMAKEMTQQKERNGDKPISYPIQINHMEKLKKVDLARA